MKQRSNESQGIAQGTRQFSRQRWMVSSAIALMLTLSGTALAAEMADGEVKRIDSAQGKITLKHGVIPALEMPSMTMVFNIKDKAALSDLKIGDKIKFQAAQEGSKFFVTEIVPQP